MSICEFYGMTENQLGWFSEAIKVEIDNTKTAVNNEEIWMLGSSTHEEALQHKMNSMELRGYLSILEHMIKGE